LKWECWFRWYDISWLPFHLSVLFISLQIKEFRVFSTHLNDSVFSSCFFYITGLHFFHLLVGLFISCLFFWASSFPSKGHFLSQVRVSEIHLFYNLQLFYWHFIEILWIFIFLVFYRFLFHIFFFTLPTWSGITKVHAQPFYAQILFGVLTSQTLSISKIHLQEGFGSNLVYRGQLLFPFLLHCILLTFTNSSPSFVS
jgi:hypothetical protein